MNGAATLAWSSDDRILERGASGGVVTTLLKFALESGRVVARDDDRPSHRPGHARGLVAGERVRPLRTGH